MDGSSMSVVGEVKFISDWMRNDSIFVERMVNDGVTHVRARRVEAALVLHGFRIGVDAPIAPENATEQDTGGYWFEISPSAKVHHAMPPRGILPNAKLTVVAHPFA